MTEKFKPNIVQQKMGEAIFGKDFWKRIVRETNLKLRKGKGT